MNKKLNIKLRVVEIIASIIGIICIYTLFQRTQQLISSHSTINTILFFMAVISGIVFSLTEAFYFLLYKNQYKVMYLIYILVNVILMVIINSMILSSWIFYLLFIVVSLSFINILLNDKLYLDYKFLFDTKSKKKKVSKVVVSKKNKEYKTSGNVSTSYV